MLQRRNSIFCDEGPKRFYFFDVDDEEETNPFLRLFSFLCKEGEGEKKPNIFSTFLQKVILLTKKGTRNAVELTSTIFREN